MRRPTDESRDFDLGDILSVTTGRLVSPRHMTGLYDILRFMTGEDIYTHQIPRVIKEASPVLLKMHPQLATVDAEANINPGNIDVWLTQQKMLFGDQLPVPKLNADEHECIDPLSELAEKVHLDRVVVVKI